MPDREKVIDELKGMVMVCAMYGDDEAIETLNSAISMLKEQEPRLLTLEEVLNADDFVWAEIYTTHKWSWCVIYVRVSPVTGNEEAVKIEEDCGTAWTKNKSEYGKHGFLDGGWRCWSARPTEEQRKAAKWDD